MREPWGRPLATSLGLLPFSTAELSKGENWCMTQLIMRVSAWFACSLMFFGALMLFDAKPAFAQASGGAVLTGTVVDASTKQPVADVVVTATAPELQGEQVVVTDSAGFYRIPSLPSGTYSLRFEGDAFKPYSRDGILLRGDATIRMNAELLPTTLKAEEVVVVAKAPTVDVGSSTTGQTITNDFTRRVPVANPSNKGSSTRSFEAVADVTPGANSDQYGTSISGASSAENGYVVDGVSVSNPGNGTIGTGLSTEFIKEVNVVSGGYMPEYGRSTGGVLSAVTKSGSNEFHGGAFSYYTPGGLQATPRVAKQNIDTIVGTSPLSYIGDVGADIGGPIQKDKLWFYAGFDYSKQAYNVQRSVYRLTNPDNPNDLSAQKIAGADRNWDAVSSQIQAIGKLTYAINQDNRITATFIAAPSWTGGAGKFSIDPLTGGSETDQVGFNGTYGSLAHQLSQSSYDASLKWSTEFDNKKILIDTLVGWHHQSNDILPSDGSLPGAKSGLASIPNISWNRGAPNYHGLNEFEPGFDAACNSTTGGATHCPVGTGGNSYYSGGPTGALHQQSFERYVVGSTLTYLFQGLGHHVAKVGFSVEYTSFDHIKAHAGGTNILESGDSTGVLSDAEHYGVLLGPDNPAFLEPFHLKTKSIIAGGFIQDSWSVMDKFTLNAGIRYDIQALYGGSGQLGLVMPNEWSPRLGLIYDPTQEGRAKLFANYARYYENVPLGLADGSLSGEPSVLATYGKYPNGCDPRVPPYCQNNASRTAANGASSPSRAWGFFGAGATPLDPSIAPTSSDEIVLGGEYELFKDARAGLTYTKRWLNRWIEDMSRDNRQTFFLGNPGHGIASDFPEAQRNYDAVTMYFQKGFGEEWLASASYTISYLRGNIGGLFAANGELDPNHNADFDSKTIMINSTGPLPGDHTHAVKLFGAKDWNFTKEHGLSTGAAFRALSGGPLNFYGADDIYGQNIYLLLPRGSAGRLPWEFDIDANIAYRYTIDRDKTITFGVDIFNLFNFQEVTARNETYTSATAVGKQNGTLKDVTVYENGATRPLYSTDKSANFLSPQSYQPPRTFRFTIRGTF